MGTKNFTQLTALTSAGAVDTSADLLLIGDASAGLLKTISADNLGWSADAASGVFNVKRYGAKGNGSDDDTAFIQAAIDATGNSGGHIYFPTGTYLHGPLTSPTTATGGLRFSGAGKFKTILQFVPTADNQNGIEINRTSGGAVSADIYSGFQLEDIQLYTTNTSYSKTALKLVDCGETSIRNVNIFGFTGTSKDAVGIWTQGRESLWCENTYIIACVPIRIGVNPDLTTGYLSGDHFTFKNMYLTCSGTPNSLTSANVLIDSGAHISQLQFIGSQAWVAGQYGLYWSMAADTYAYCSSVRLENVRTETGTLATAYSVYISARTNTPLLNLSMVNCEFDVAREGVYTRNVNNQTWESMLMYHPSPRVIANVGTAFLMDWRGVVTKSTADTSSVVLDSNMYLSDAAPQAQGLVWPYNATWVRRSTAATYNERPTREMLAHKWYWSGSLADDATVQLPTNSDTNNWLHAKVNVVATIAGSNILEYGEWYLAPVTGLTNGVVKANGSTNTSAGDVDTDLCVYCDGASPMYAGVYVKNRLGGTANVTVEVVGKRSVET